MAKVVLDHITKIFFPGTEKEVVAVDDLSMEIPNGGFAALLGPSGCGKTTTMRIIAGLEHPTTGRVYFDDQDVTNISTEERNVAMVFQSPVVYPTMSVYDNIAFPLIVRKTPKIKIKENVKEIAEILGLSSILHEKPKRFHPTLKQKVALARAMVRTPNIFLLDEPLTNIDPKARLELRAKIKELQSKLKQTMLYVTHDQGEALTLAEKIGVMKDGRILQYDTPENLYSRPSSSFVAWFIGNPGMNLLSASLKELKGKTVVDLGVITYDVTRFADAIKEQATTAEVILGIRPEHIQVSKSRREGWIPAKCTSIERLGNLVMLYLKAGVLLMRAKVPPIDISEGDEVWIFLPEDKTRIFDKKTGDLLI